MENSGTIWKENYGDIDILKTTEEIYMKKLIALLVIIGIMLSGCVAKPVQKTDNNDTSNDGKDGGESDVVEKTITNNNNVKSDEDSNIKFGSDMSLSLII